MKQHCNTIVSFRPYPNMVKLSGMKIQQTIRLLLFPKSGNFRDFPSSITFGNEIPEQGGFGNMLNPTSEKMMRKDYNGFPPKGQ